MSLPYLAFLVCAVIQSIASTGADALLPFYVKSLGMSTALAGLPFILNSVARVFIDPFLGVIADRMSSKSFLILSLLMGAVFALLAGMIPRPTPFLVFWIFTGISLSMFAVGMRKVAFENARPGKEGSAIGNITTLYGIGNVAGPPVAGFLGSLQGPRVLFLIYALPLFLCMGLCWIFPLISSNQRPKKRTEKKSPFSEGKELLYLPAFLTACLTMFYMFFSRWGAMKVAFPLFVVEVRGFTLADVGTILGAAGLADLLGRYSGGLICDRWETRNAIQWALPASGIFFALITLAPGFNGLLGLACGTGLAHGFLNVTATTFSMEAADEDQKGLALALSRWFGSMGAITGPLLIGILAEAIGYNVVFLVVGISAIGLACIIKLRLLRSLSSQAGIRP